MRSVIARLGYAGASLRKVAQQAGYTTGAVTYYFANKEAMVTAIVEHLFDEFDAMLDIGPEVSDIKRRFERWLALNADSDVWLAQFQLLAQARHEPAFAAVYQRRYARYREVLSGILAKQQAAGAIRSDIPADLLADHLGAIGDGWMMMLPIEPERFKPSRVQALLDSIITMLSPSSGAKPATDQSSLRQSE